MNNSKTHIPADVSITRAMAVRVNNRLAISNRATLTDSTYGRRGRLGVRARAAVARTDYGDDRAHAPTIAIDVSVRAKKLRRASNSYRHAQTGAVSILHLDIFKSTHSV